MRLVWDVAAWEDCRQWQTVDRLSRRVSAILVTPSRGGAEFDEVRSEAGELIGHGPAQPCGI